MEKHLPLICLTVVFCASQASAVELEGYTEPYRTIQVAADETGTIAEMYVSEGQQVEAGESLVRLKSDVQEALLAIAEQNMLAKGRLDAAEAELRMRQERLLKFEALLVEGHARQEEVDRAASQVAIATANVRTAEEDLVTRQLEHQKIKAQLDLRTIRAPISGVVTTLHKDVGEFLAPNSPDVLTLVQIDTLLANFTVISLDAGKLQLGQEVKVRFTVSGEVATGTVEFVSPVTDAESGTVLVKLRIANPENRLRSGERCRIRFGE